jgi:hypothetical protein
MSEFEPEADERLSDVDDAMTDEPADDGLPDYTADEPAGAAEEPAAAAEQPSADAGAHEHASERTAEEGADWQPGDSTVAGALGELDVLDDLDLAAHPDVYQRIHGELQRALSSIDDA